MRVDRLLSILLIISSKDIVTGKELADYFEVSLRTIYRDIEKICQAGVPIASTGGKGGGFHIMENYNIDKLFLNRGEANTLMVLMNSLNQIFGKNKRFNDIALKFENAYKDDNIDEEYFNISISHFSMEEELKEYLYLINKAIKENKLLVFEYINRNMEYAERTVEPIQIDFSYGQWHLVAFCRNRDAIRKFKLVRIRNLNLGDMYIKQNITKRDIEKALNDGYDNKSIEVTLKFTHKIGQQLPEYFNKDKIEQLEDGSYIVKDFFPNEEGLIKYILSFGKECEVISPQKLREDTKKYLQKVIDKY